MDKCFAEGYKGKCNALKYKNCDGCKFYKPKKQVQAERERTIHRLLVLDRYDEVRSVYGTLK